MTTVAILPLPTEKGILYQGTAGDKHSRGRTWEKRWMHSRRSFLMPKKVCWLSFKACARTDFSATLSSSVWGS